MKIQENRIAEAMARAGIHTPELSSRTGILIGRINLWRENHEQPTLKQLRIVAAELEVTLDSLASIKGDTHFLRHLEVISTSYPADSDDPQTAEIGQRLLLQAIFENWHDLEPTIVARYAQLCEGAMRAEPSH